MTILKMRILHLANDYSGSTVYKNLVGQLDELGIEQIVYNPVRDPNRVGKNKIVFRMDHSNIIYSPILNYNIDRIFYRKKIKKILKDVEAKIDLSKVSLIHAHTWYSDGGVAYLLHKKYGLPYIVAIRNSDLNVFQKYLLHEHTFGRSILEHASKIIVISASYRERVLSLQSLQKLGNSLSSKLKVIANGIDPFWLQNIKTKKRAIAARQTCQLIYIGKFDKGKNLPLLQQAIITLNNEGVPCRLHIVGGGGADTTKVLDRVNKFPTYFQFHGKVMVKSDLLKIIRQCDIFAMPSSHETFGLVYVEAMTQGLPILYTQGEGIDGFYNESIGEKVVNFSVAEVMNKLKVIIENYESFNIPIEKIRQLHNWQKISLIYSKLYSNIVK